MKIREGPEDREIFKLGPVMYTHLMKLIGSRMAQRCGQSQRIEVWHYNLAMEPLFASSSLILCEWYGLNLD